MRHLSGYEDAMNRTFSLFQIYDSKRLKLGVWQQVWLNLISGCWFRKQENKKKILVTPKQEDLLCCINVKIKGNVRQNEPSPVFVLLLHESSSSRLDYVKSNKKKHIYGCLPQTMRSVQQIFCCSKFKLAGLLSKSFLVGLCEQFGQLLLSDVFPGRNVHLRSIYC